MRLVLPVMAFAASLLSTGCGEKAPTISPDQLPSVLIDIELSTEQIIEAFEAGDPARGDRAMHHLPKLYDSAARLGKAVLDAQQLAALRKAVDHQIETLASIHGPMHTGKLPEDFEFAPIREELQVSLNEIRAAVPTDIATKMQEASEAREAAQAAEPKTDEGTEADDDSTEVETNRADTPSSPDN